MVLNVNNIFANNVEGGQDEFFVSEAEGRLVPRIITKSVDEVIVSSTTYKVDDELKMELSANATYRFILTFGVDNESSDPDIKYTVAGPTGSIGKQEVIVWEGSDVDGIDGAGASINYDDIGVENAGGKFESENVVNDTWFRITGFCKVGKESGDLEFKWAQLNSHVDDCKVLAGSTLEVIRL